MLKLKRSSVFALGTVLASLSVQLHSVTGLRLQPSGIGSGSDEESIVITPDPFPIGDDGNGNVNDQESAVTSETNDDPLDDAELTSSAEEPQQPNARKAFTHAELSPSAVRFEEREDQQSNLRQRRTKDPLPTIEERSNGLENKGKGKRKLMIVRKLAKVADSKVGRGVRTKYFLRSFIFCIIHLFILNFQISFQIYCVRPESGGSDELVGIGCP